jgi:hypothetical protein
MDQYQKLGQLIGLLGQMATQAMVLDVVRTTRPDALPEHSSWRRMDRLNRAVQDMLQSDAQMRALFGKLVDETEVE